MDCYSVHDENAEVPAGVSLSKNPSEAGIFVQCDKPKEPV